MLSRHANSSVPPPPAASAASWDVQCVVGFTIEPALCGMAAPRSQVLAFRLLEGMCAAAGCKRPCSISMPRSSGLRDGGLGHGCDGRNRSRADAGRLRAQSIGAC